MLEAAAPCGLQPPMFSSEKRIVKILAGRMAKRLTARATLRALLLEFILLTSSLKTSTLTIPWAWCGFTQFCSSISRLSCKVNCNFASSKFCLAAVAVSSAFVSSMCILCFLISTRSCSKKTTMKYVRLKVKETGSF